MINYKGTPLLGEDSNPQHTSEFFASAGTVLFWIIFTIVSFVIKPPAEKLKYKEVQIVLSSTPVVQKTEEAPAPAEAASASAASEQTEPVVEQLAETAAAEVPVIETPAVEAPAPKVETAPLVKETPPAPKPVEKKVETPKPKVQPKPEPKKEAPKTQNQKTPDPAPAKKVEPVEPIEYAVDPMEAFAAQTRKQPKKDFDWSQFDDEPAETQTASQVKTVQTKEPAFSGTAGTAEPVADQKVSSTSSNSNSKSQSASTATSSALEGIKNSSFRGNAANGVQSETSVKAKESGSGRVMMEMSGGRTRALISPAKPVINLSAQAAATIDNSITVTIKFRVVEAGNVPRAEITITPESTLHQLVRDEIRNQISTWRFEPADYTATASFEYKIIKN